MRAAPCHASSSVALLKALSVQLVYRMTVRRAAARARRSKPLSRSCLRRGRPPSEASALPPSATTRRGRSMLPRVSRRSLRRDGLRNTESSNSRISNTPKFEQPQRCPMCSVTHRAHTQPLALLGTCGCCSPVPARPSRAVLPPSHAPAGLVFGLGPSGLRTLGGGAAGGVGGVPGPAWLCRSAQQPVVSTYRARYSTDGGAQGSFRSLSGRAVGRLPPRKRTYGAAVRPGLRARRGEATSVVERAGRPGSGGMRASARLCAPHACAARLVWLVCRNSRGRMRVGWSRL